MVTIEEVAGYICKVYKCQTNVEIDEMKLHKMLYFAQREHFIAHKTPFFSEQFIAKQFGPVSPKVRELFKQRKLGLYSLRYEDIHENKKILDVVISKYSSKSSWMLSSISHGEESWIRAQKRGEISGDYTLREEDIAEDALRIKLRRLVKS